MISSSPRFKNITKTKSKLTVLTPAPGEYQLIAKWPGKTKKDQFDKEYNW